MKTVSLTVRNIPRPVIERLRARAKSRHRSMQGEILAILERAAAEAHPARTITELWAAGQAAGVRTERESTAWIRADRDDR